MSGQPIPPRLVEAFAKNAGPTYITSPFPVPSQITVTPGAASLNDGFPPQCFQDPVDGGVLPSGADFNGILYLLSAWVAYLAAGQLPEYDATLQTDMGGYAIGTRLLKADGSGNVWINLVDGNTTDPDTGGAGWLSSVPLYSAAALTGVNDVVLPGVSDYFIDVDTSGGSLAYTGFVPKRDGQRVTFTKMDASANVLSFASLSGASAAGHKMRLVGTMTLDQQYETFTIQFNSSINAWIPV